MASQKRATPQNKNSRRPLDTNDDSVAEKYESELDKAENPRTTERSTRSDCLGDAESTKPMSRADHEYYENKGYTEYHEEDGYDSKVPTSYPHSENNMEYEESRLNRKKDYDGNQTELNNRPDHVRDQEDQYDDRPKFMRPSARRAEYREDREDFDGYAEPKPGKDSNPDRRIGKNPVRRRTDSDGFSRRNH